MTASELCGSDTGVGVTGCQQPQAVWVDITDRNGLELAAILCHEHAARLRAGEDIWDEAGWSFDGRPYVVTSWRSL